MPDNTARFETDAVGTTPKGWTGTRTGRGDPRWTVEHDQHGTVEIEGTQTVGSSDLSAASSRTTPTSRTALSR